MNYFVEDQEEENERFAETIQALRRQVRTLTNERDEARAEVVRLGKELEALKKATGMKPREQLGVRVDVAHPRRKEKVGDVMTHLCEESARYAPSVWAGWTLVHRTVVHHETEWTAVEVKA